MKKIDSSIDIKLKVTCPYCNRPSIHNLYDMEMEDIEAILRGFVRMISIGEYNISSVKVPCNRCGKIYTINEVKWDNEKEEK